MERERDIKERKEKKMTKEEIMKKIEQLQNRLFMINMIDRWTNEDRRRMEETEDEIRELKMQLA